MTGENALTSERLELRPLAKSDLPELVRLFDEERVLRYLADGSPVTRTQLEEWVHDSEETFERCGIGLFAVRERSREPLVGVTGFREFYEPPSMELIYLLDPAVFGRGYATEMARVAIEAGFAAGLDPVRASTDVPNEDSVRVMRRLGLEFERRSPGAKWEQVHYAITRERWNAGEPPTG